MIDTSKMPLSLEKTIALAAMIVSEQQGASTLARQDPSFQRREYQRFFLQGIYGDLTGLKQACDKEIMALAVTDEAAQWIGTHCLNQYWFWSVIGAAAKLAGTLPLTLSDVEKGAQSLFDERRQAMGKVISIGGWPRGYSGEYTPWHVRDSFVRGILWNYEQGAGDGLAYGMLLVQRYKPTNKLHAALAGKLPQYGAQLIFNPLFDKLASQPPVIPESSAA